MATKKGKCRRCAQIVPLRKGNIARDHLRPAWIGPNRTTCSGSGMRCREVIE